MTNKTLLILLTTIIFTSCLKKNDYKLVRNHSKVYTFNDTAKVQKYLDNLSICGYEIGKTNKNDLGNNYSETELIIKSENVFTYSFSNNSFSNVDELIKYDKNYEKFRYIKKINFEDSIIKIKLDFYKNKLYKIEVSNFPISFLKTLNLNETLATGYHYSFQYKKWIPKFTLYELKASQNINLKWETNTKKISLIFKADTTGYNKNSKGKLNSNIVFIDKTIENIQKKDIKYIKKDSESDIKKIKLLDDLAKLLIILENNKLNKEEFLQIVEKLNDIQNKIDKLSQSSE